MELLGVIAGSPQQFDVSLDFFSEPMHLYTLPDNTHVLSPVAWADCGIVNHMPQHVIDEMNTSFGCTGMTLSQSNALPAYS